MVHGRRQVEVEVEAQVGALVGLLGVPVGHVRRLQMSAVPCGSSTSSCSRSGW